MNNNEELLKKWQLKKIATLAFINDECDDMKPKDRKAFYSLMEAIFGEIVGDLKNLTLADVMLSLPNTEEIEAWAKEQAKIEPTGAEEFGRKWGAIWMRALIEQKLKGNGA